MKLDSSNNLTNRFSYSREQEYIAERIRDLEGQCRIIGIQFLNRNIPKTVALMFLLIVTVVGLIPLKYFPKFRKHVFYQKCKCKQATHMYITGKGTKDDIVKLDLSSGFPKTFIYRKLRYIMISEHNFFPVGFNIEKQFSKFINEDKIANGLTSKEVLEHKKIFGNNQHPVEMPNYFAYLLDVLTEPYFLLQYFFCFAFFLQGYAPFSIALLAFTLITVTINYVLLFFSFKKIKEIAQKTYEVKVIRNSEVGTFLNTDLVPGDIYIPEQEIPADSLIIKGDIYVNEANLTGESHPIGKFPIETPNQTNKSCVWLYEGSKIIDQTQNSKAIVINTNFTTHRGQIIRSILTRKIKDPDIIRSLLVMTFEIFLVSLIVFFSTLFILLGLDTEPIFSFFKFVDYLGSSAPPPLPIFFNIAYTLSLVRLRWNGIIGTQPHKTVEGAQVKNLCFDKTGTLTQPKVLVKKIYKLKRKQIMKELNISNALLDENRLIWSLFATCHTIKIIQNEVLGEEIDQQMFLFSKCWLQKSQKKQVKIEVKQTKSSQEVALQVLRINQFESKFRSMSVLVYDKVSKKYYVFVKGAPQKINHASINSTTLIIDYLKQLSLEGLRTIAFAYKQIQQDEVSKYLNLEREDFQKEIKCLGLVAFENHLKHDTPETMAKLHQSNISCKIITGDNIYIAVETARRAGIIAEHEKVLYFEGNNQTSAHQCSEETEEKERSFIGVCFNQNREEERRILKENLEYLSSSEYTYAIDNAFFQMNNRPFIPSQVKVFARITPENKAEIVRTYKAQDKLRREKTQNKLSKFLKKDKLKVGMCGDGANDLLALKQADLSIGIQQTDASYGSSYTIKKVLDVEHIIRESKCTQSNIIDLYQFYLSVSMSGLFLSIIMLTDSTYYSTAEIMYLNFGVVLISASLLTFNRPSKEPSKTVPNSNALNLHNHLIIWGHISFSFLAALGGYLYFYNTQEFQENPKPKIRIAEGGFNSKNHSATISFLMMILIAPINVILIYRSKPFKRRIWYNPALTIVFIGNIITAVAFIFLNSQLEEAFEIEPISIPKISISFAIVVGVLAVLAIYNTIVNHFKLNQIQLGEKQ